MQLKRNRVGWREGLHSIELFAGRRNGVGKIRGDITGHKLIAQILPASLGQTPPGLELIDMARNGGEMEFQSTAAQRRALNGGVFKQRVADDVERNELVRASSGAEPLVSNASCICGEELGLFWAGTTPFPQSP